MMARDHERGMVSLFIVLFTALLTVVVTVGFMRNMIQAQQQVSAADVSASAYDAARAGVEDAKRALARYHQVCQTKGSPECDRQTAVIQKNECTTLQQLGVATGDQEVVVKQQDDDSAFQQAYTCVKMKVDSQDYQGTLDPMTARLIPLKGQSAFDRVSIEWFSAADMQSDGTTSIAGVDLEASAQLPEKDAWPKNRPALLRVQLAQFGDTFRLSDFDNRSDDGHMNAGTLFLYPAQVGRTDPIVMATEDMRHKQPNGVLQQIACQPNVAEQFYACQATIVLPQVVGGSDDTTPRRYLRIDGLYNKSNNFRIQLFKDTTPVRFSGVQATIDSTGRASNQFRRIESRVEVATNTFPYPQAAIDITGNLCKTMMVTDSPEAYDSGLTECNPSTYQKKNK